MLVSVIKLAEDVQDGGVYLSPDTTVFFPTDVLGPSMGSIGGSGVLSVNSKTGNVTLVPADIGAEVAGSAVTEVGLHVAQSDPHTQYAKDTDLAAHVSASDPHPVYATDADLAALDYQDVGADIAGAAAYAISTLPQIEGGTNIKLTKSGGIITIDLIDTPVIGGASFTDPVFTGVATNTFGYSAGALTGGVYKGSAFAVIGSYTQNTTAADKFIGKALYYNVKRIATSNAEVSNGAAGPSDVGFGPGGIIQISGTTEFQYNQTNFNWGPIIFASQHQVRSQGTAGSQSITPAWGFMESTMFVADTKTVTLLGTDMGAYAGMSYGDWYAAGFVDNRTFWTENGGSFDGTVDLLHGVHHVGFDSIPAFLGHTEMWSRIGVWIHDANLGNGLWPGDNPDEVNGTLHYNNGIRIDRLRAGDVLNTGIICNSPVLLWGDATTQTSNNDSRLLELTAAPGDPLQIGVGGDHHVNYTTPALNMIQTAGTWTFKQRPNVLGALSAFYSHPIIKNDPSVHSGGGSKFVTINTMMYLNPTFASDTTNGAVNYGNMYGYVTQQDFTRPTGSNAVTVDQVIGADYRLGVGSGVTVTSRTALNISNFSGVLGNGTGAVQQNIGINIDVLTGDVPLGIVNKSMSILSGGIYGSILSSGSLTIGSTSASAKGDVNIDNPTLHLAYASHTVSTGPYYTVRHDGTVVMNDPAGALGTTNLFAMMRMSTTVNIAQTGTALAPGTMGLDFEPILQNNTTGSMNIGGIAALYAVPTLRANAPGVGNTITIQSVFGVYFKPVMSVVTNGALTIAAYTAGYLAGPSIPSSGTITAGVGLQVQGPAVASGATITNQWKGVEILTGTFTAGGAWTTQYGLDIGALSGATNSNVAIITRGSANPVLFAGKVTMGGTTAGTWNAHVQGGNSATTGLGIDVSTTAPTAPASSAGSVFSVYKGSTNTYLLITYNDAGTPVYFYTRMNGIANGSIVWTKATTLPS